MPRKQTLSQRKGRREKDAELYALARDLTVSDEALARQAVALTKRMTPPNAAFVCMFAAMFRAEARKATT